MRRQKLAGISAARALMKTLFRRVPRGSDWLLPALIALAAFLRFYRLGGESLWGDEAFSVLWSRPGAISIVESTATSENHPPLYYLLLHFWMVLFGDSEAAIRALSACFGVVSVLLLFEIGRQLFGRRAGMIASFLLAISVFSISYSQEARQYSLLLMLSLASFLFLIRILRAERIRRLDIAAYLLVNVLLCYTHLFGLLTIGAQVLYFLSFRRRYARAGVAFWGVQIATLICFSPWIYVLVAYTVKDVGNSLSWIPEPGLRIIVRTLAELSGAWYLWRPTGAVLMLGLLVFGLAGVFLVPESRERRDNLESTEVSRLRSLAQRATEPRTALLLAWFIVPVVLALLLSVAITSLFLSRYLIGVIPALFLLVAHGICKIDLAAKTNGWRVHVAIIFVVLVAVVSAPGLYRYFTHHQKPEWREVVSLIKQQSESGDTVIVYPEEFRLPFYYYYDEGRLTVSRETHGVVGIEEPTSWGDRVWLVFASWDPDRDAKMRDDLLAQFAHDPLVFQKEFHVITVYLFDT